jgi:DASS family divalent anion:Na+ symporter
MKSRIWKLAVCIAVPIGILLLPVPKGLTLVAWQLLALYLAAILGLLLRPMPEPAVLLAVIGISSVCFRNSAILLAGYTSSTVWLVFCAFMIGTAIVQTGLGRRFAYVLIGRMGKGTLGLGYVTACTDLVLSPVTPSNTARSGGIIFPIVRSLAESLGSRPGATSRRVGAYLTVLLYQISLTTGYIFITGIAPNFLSAKFGQEILKVDITWLLWFKAAVVPGMICLLIVPLLVYWMYPPELKSFDSRKLSKQGLADLGPFSRREKVLSVLFVLAILGWATGGITRIDATAVAIAFVGACLVLGVITWDDLVATKGAWSTFIWYGGVVGLADGLAKAKFFDWMAKVLSSSFNFNGLNGILTLAILVLVSLLVRYLFASMATFVTTMVPVLLTLALVAHAPVYPAFFLIAFAACYGCVLTHYGGAVGPVLFGEGYVDQATWWKIGAVFTLISFVIHMTVGLFYWKLIGLW